MSLDRYEVFRRDMPGPYLRDCLTGLFEDYLSAAEWCGDRFEPTEAFNVLPFYRRGMIEGTIRDAARSHKQMKVTVERDGFWNHSVISVGDCIMTQATLKHPDDLVRPSMARQCYCEPDNQRYLPFHQPVTPNRRGFVYGLLVHGREPLERFFPAFAHIVFPNRLLDGYFSRRIDLFKEFPGVVRQCTSGIFEERNRNLKQQFANIDMPEPELREETGEPFA